MPRILTQAHVDQFRNRLCDVAARLYFEMGHGDFNMRDLAARVGVSAMTPYRYFGDKEGILAAVRARGVARLADRLEAAAPQGPAALMQAYIGFAMEEAAYYRLIFDLSQPPALAELTRQEQRIRLAMAEAVAGEDSDAEKDTLTRSLWAALHGAICLVIAGKLSEPELGDLASRLALIFMGSHQHFTVPPLQTSPARDPLAGPAQMQASAPTQVAAE